MAMDNNTQKQISELKGKLSNLQVQIEENYKVRQELYKQRADIDAEIHKLANGNLDDCVGKYITITLHTSIDDIYYFCKLEKYQVIGDSVEFYGIWLNYSAREYITVKKEVCTFTNGSFDVECISQEEFQKKFNSLVANANNKLFENKAQEEKKEVFNHDNIKLD